MASASTPAEDAPRWARPLHERQIALLGQLAEAGLAMALMVKDQAQALAAEGGVEPGVLEGLTRAYGRVARATRLTLMLQDRLIKDLVAVDKRIAHEAGWDRDVQTRDRKARVERILARVAARQHDDIETIFRLEAEAAERLDQDDLYGPLLARPVSELVAMIAHDLGLDPDWPQLAEEAWAQEEEASGAVGWPLRGAPLNSSPMGEEFRGACSLRLEHRTGLNCPSPLTGEGHRAGSSLNRRITLSSGP
jgi:hypothetical protein